MPRRLTIKNGSRRLMIAARRYYETFVKTDGARLFREPKLFLDWLEQRAL